MMSSEVIEILHKCRQQLQECAVAPLSFDDALVEEISNECNIAVTELKELKTAKARGTELNQKCTAVKDLPNKMQYSNVQKELAVVQNKIKELTHETNHLIRNCPELLDNKKRVKIYLDRLDDILRITQIELSEFDEASTIVEETSDYVPLKTAREKALADMKATLKSLEEVRETLQREKADHRELVYGLKTEIKSTRADLNAMEDGTYAPAVEFEKKLSANKAAQTNKLESAQKAIEDEIEQLQSAMAKDTLVHDASMSALEVKKTELELKLSNMRKENCAVLEATKAELDKLRKEQNENYEVLMQLEKRLADEVDEERMKKEEEARRLQEDEAKKAMEEEMHFASMRIQLQWKRYLKKKTKSSKGKKAKKVKGKKTKKK